MEADGYAVAQWVKEMVNSGHPTFYQRDDDGVVIGVYDPRKCSYVPLDQDPRVVVIADLRAAGKAVEGNGGASLVDMGDGVVLLEFHSKANAIDDDIIKMGWQALDRLQPISTGW